MNPPAATSQDYAHCAETLAQFDRDAWLAALFIPERFRPDVHALYAFAHEIARVRDLVSDPRLGEIRLQWWREVLQGERVGEGRQNPVAAALMAAISKYNLPVQALLDMIEARRFDLYCDPMPTLNDLEGYCGETSSVLFRLVTLVLNEGADCNSAEACGHAGVAAGLTRILRELPEHVRGARCFMPREMLELHGAERAQAAAGDLTAGVSRVLAELRAMADHHLKLAKTAAAKLPPALHPAFAPLATVPLYLQAMERQKSNQLAEGIDISQWRRQWAMWRWRL